MKLYIPLLGHIDSQKIYVCLSLLTLSYATEGKLDDISTALTIPGGNGGDLLPNLAGFGGQASFIDALPTEGCTDLQNYFLNLAFSEEVDFNTEIQYDFGTQTTKYSYDGHIESSSLYCENNLGAKIDEWRYQTEGGNSLFNIKKLTVKSKAYVAELGSCNQDSCDTSATASKISRVKPFAPSLLRPSKNFGCHFNKASKMRFNPEQKETSQILATTSEDNKVSFFSHDKNGLTFLKSKKTSIADLKGNLKRGEIGRVVCVTDNDNNQCCAYIKT